MTHYRNCVGTIGNSDWWFQISIGQEAVDAAIAVNNQTYLTGTIQSFFDLNSGSSADYTYDNLGKCSNWSADYTSDNLGKYFSYSADYTFDNLGKYFSADYTYDNLGIIQRGDVNRKTGGANL